MSDDVRERWDEHAATFDDDADHGLRDPGVRSAWARLLRHALPSVPASVADLGCGTGSLSVLVASAGHRVWGLDVSPRMLEVAAGKAASHGVPVTFVRGDAAAPPLRAGSCDVVLARHVLWALPDPAAALARWVALLRPGGRIVLIEGRWATGAGLPARECAALVRRCGRTARVQVLDDPALWGRTITDERYLLLSPTQPQAPPLRRLGGPSQA